MSLLAASLAATAATTAAAAILYTDELVDITPAGGDVYAFSEGGFTGGGAITGSFTADGVNYAGQISTFEGDVTAFSFSWSGNAAVPAFSGDITGLFGLVWDDTGQPLGTGVYGDVEGVLAYSANYDAVWGAGPGPISFGPCTGSNICGVVETVPEPGAWALMLVGVGLVGATLRRHHRRGHSRLA